MPDLSQTWVVLKFGGTSVSTAANWHNIAQVLKARLRRACGPLVVHSALSGITDRLESLLTAARPEITRRCWNKSKINIARSRQA